MAPPDCPEATVRVRTLMTSGMRALGASMLALCLGGCYLPFGVVEHYKPDPDRDKAVEIRDVVDGKVLLADGRSVQLAGVNLRLSPRDPSLEPDLARDQRDLLVRAYVLVRTDAAGKAELTAVNYWRTEERYDGPVCPSMAGLGSKYHTADVPVVLLIPIIVDQNERWDVGETLLGKGLATVDGQSNPDTKRPRRRHARLAWASGWGRRSGCLTSSAGIVPRTPRGCSSREPVQTPPIVTARP